jgi:hypothetical protein
MKFPKIKAVTAIKKYILHVEFTDGTKGNYDVEFLAGKGVFKSWDKDDNSSKFILMLTQEQYHGQANSILIQYISIVLLKVLMQILI